MGRYLLRRLLQFIPTLLLISFITFALGYYGPGDPIRIMMGDRLGDELAYQRLRHQYGYDRPFLVQWGDYVLSVLRGDFGISLTYRDQAVGPRMFEALRISAQLSLVAVLIALILGIPIGVLTAVQRNSPLDYALISGVVLLSSIPPYVLAPLLMILLVLNLKVLTVVPIGWEGIFSQKILLPAFILGLGPMVSLARQTRASVIEALTAEHVRTARAKGLPERLVLLRHVLRNALTPIITVSGLVVGSLITGAVFVENIFAIPGFGRLFSGAVSARDFPMLMSTTLMSAIILVVANLIVDIVYGFLDPRVRFE